MNYGFVIDNGRCIGCHACSTACKSENEVPLGVHRTWVKYTETGRFPDTKRQFHVLRCNHCSNPPCVRICPTEAMFQRDDGIVEFASDSCIGCKGCIQACPYDAIHIDPESGTAAKCHYCGHRVDIGLEPACVVVCPEHAIISGDLDDPDSEIAKVVAGNAVTVRKPEQGTAPNLFYIEGHAAALHPTAANPSPETFMFSDVMSGATDGGCVDGGDVQGLPGGGPIQIGGKTAEHMVQVAYNAGHHLHWRWPVSTYLVTKGLGMGLLGLLAVFLLWGTIPVGAGDQPAVVVTGLLGLVFSGITAALLVLDLERPERFLKILTQPQWKSWLTRGAFILIAHALLATVWVAMGAMGHGLHVGAAIGVLVLSIGGAAYTAFLFAQAEGRDLWQSPLLPLHLVLQAAALGSVVLVAVTAAMDPAGLLFSDARTILFWAVGGSLVAMLGGEFAIPHASENAVRASHEITRGRWRFHFWIGGVLAGHLVPLAAALVMAESAPALAVAAIFSVAGAWCYEHAFVIAPQQVPNS